MNKWRFNCITFFLLLGKEGFVLHIESVCYCNKVPGGLHFLWERLIQPMNSEVPAYD